MRMRINAARHDVAARCINHLVAFEIGANRDDAFTLDQHIRFEAAIGGNDGSVFDHCRHDEFPSPVCDHPITSAFSSTACMSTFVPMVAHSWLMSSASLWLMPSTQGVKIIEVGATRAM